MSQATDPNAAPERELVVGIDLGTTNSLVACAQGGAPAIVRDGAGRPVNLPSAVSFLEDGRVLVGEAALERAPLAPARTLLSIKRLMGKGLADLGPAVRRQYAAELVEEERQLVRVRLGDRTVTPQEVSSLILRELKRRAEEGLGREVRKAVITVPAYFDDAQRQATRDAGRMAGLEVLRIINEPTAASLAYGLGGKEAEGVIAVYDLGGGTFDLSLLRVQAGTFRVLATCGDTLLGGDDIDRILVDSALEALGERGLDANDPRLRAQLRAAAEAAKIRLSTAERTTLRVTDPTRGVHLELDLERRELERAMEPLVERTLALCAKALADAGMQASAVDEVVLVGGSTRIPYVRERVGTFFGRAPHTELDPDEVVALGAAVQADILGGGDGGELLLLDVTPLSLGLETYGGAVNKLIMANAQIPAVATETFTTPKDDVTAIDLHVVQGERELVSDCRSLARFKLKIPPMPAGLPKVEVTFLIDADGILRVSAIEERSGAEASIEVVPVHGLTEEEVDRIMEDSYEHALADVAAHRLIDLRNESSSVLRAARRALGQAGDALAPAQRQAIEEAAERLEALSAGEDGDAIKAALDALNQVAEPLAQIVLDRALAEAVRGRRVDELEVQG
ncbi:MAG: Fe-S protein assembly chaperone HscA [Planctomycetota bacterium]|nr:MAG: Fe-S protein assembly chaperone HscA [Planctomycetota bacterium]